MLDVFQFSFLTRALLAGLAAGLICPSIGVFLVLRRFSLIADTLSHVALAGVALGLLLGIYPGATA
ncbi:MAG: ABC-type transporter, integral rane subunit, partial [Dehalococcoidia bacterium]|nr:ABC-type transporter, integral rane subunit [Dehalococcoidia bacterium]